MILLTQGPPPATAGFTPHLSDGSQKNKTADLPSLRYPTPHPFELGRELPLSFPSTSIDSLLLLSISFGDLGGGGLRSAKHIRTCLNSSLSKGFALILSRCL